MRGRISINQTQERLIMKIGIGLEQSQIMDELKQKAPRLKKLYKSERLPIHVIGKNLTPSEKIEIEGYLQQFLDVEIIFEENDEIIVEENDEIIVEEKPKKLKTEKKKTVEEKTMVFNMEELGLHTIKETYEEDTTLNNTKFYTNSVRCGQKLEFDGSLVILGDVNGGAEIIATGNIVVLGMLRGVAHAGAKGNRKAMVAAQQIKAPQLRIADVVKEIVENAEMPVITKRQIAYIKDEEIIIE